MRCLSMSLEGIVKRLALICLALCSSVHGQTNSPGATSPFEVASVKPSASAAVRLVQAVPGRLLMENFASRTLIVLAYGVADYQGCRRSILDRFRSLRRPSQAESGDATFRQMGGPMLQALLVERFGVPSRDAAASRVRTDPCQR